MPCNNVDMPLRVKEEVELAKEPLVPVAAKRYMPRGIQDVIKLIL